MPGEPQPLFVTCDGFCFVVVESAALLLGGFVTTGWLWTTSENMLAQADCVEALAIRFRLAFECVSLSVSLSISSS